MMSTFVIFFKDFPVDQVFYDNNSKMYKNVNYNDQKIFKKLHLRLLMAKGELCWAITGNFEITRCQKHEGIVFFYKIQQNSKKTNKIRVF
jgi:hypothetical protein